MLRRTVLRVAKGARAIHVHPPRAAPGTAAAAVSAAAAAEKRSEWFSAAVAGVVAGVGAVAAVVSYAIAEDAAPGVPGVAAPPAGSVEAGVPAVPSPAPAERPKPWITREVLAAHNTAEKRVWVSYREGVYDITDFVLSHPGGVSKIMLAAGKAIDPFWRVYQQHENSKLPKQLLAGMRIGSLDPEEPELVLDDSDPYANDPHRHPGLTYHNRKPANAELPPALIMDNWITPSALFFIRHHHPVPTIDLKEFELDVGGKGVKPIRLTLEDMRERFPKSSVTTTIQCGGNRRNEFNSVHTTSGIGWGFGAISNSTFSGVLLRDVLMYSGLLTPERASEIGVKHVQFKGVDGVEASIPIEKALSPYGDVLLAYEMNGELLPPEHGGPLRIIVPGHVGIRNIKWVESVATSDEEAGGYWQRGAAYKGFAPGITSFEGMDVSKIQSVQEQPVTSAIVEPQSGEKIEAGETVTVKGFAWSGGGRGIVRVDVSADGKTWKTATLTAGKEQGVRRAWAWTFWEVEIETPATLKPGETVTLMCKATDAAYNNQPERAEPIWNIRGLNNNSWHRVEVVCDDSDDDDDDDNDDEDDVA